MAVIMIDAKGLLEGKRLRKLGLKARLYYPLLLGMANTYARLELDYDLLAARFIPSTTQTRRTSRSGSRSTRGPS